ncbi:GIY-YIG nuclease family protein [Methylobacterium sp. J-030]|uniref:GIY-YIG nuclease family protein n=1 Tax=Methylobacterium sp. J-030 TaxID=2836627 RepID=UPI001FBB8504|nr:GIY-YIG nuclease family protein [Methylobacterium sp. J-030]MCJ2073184.1 GIY-YIG nuclease family protein [Methylobacterium sp. J-030]
MARRIGTSFIYFVSCEGFTKVGVAQDVTARVRTIGTSCPWPVRLEAHILGDERDEAHLHSFFRSEKLHHRNEWFVRAGKLAELLDTLAPYSHSFVAATAMAEHWWSEQTKPIREKDRIGTRGWPPTIDEVRAAL